MALTKIDDRGLNTPIDLLDNEKIRFGTGTDLEIYHDGTDSYLKNSTNNFRILADDFGVNNAANSEVLLRGVQNGSVYLNYDDSKKFETTATGINIDGSNTTGSTVRGDFRFKEDDNNTTRVLWDASAGEIRWNDDFKAAFGDSGDLEIYHNGSDSYIKNGQGSLKICDTNVYLMNGAADEYTLKAIQNESVELYYDNVKKIETTSEGAIISGSEGQPATLAIYADEGDDNADKWRLRSETSGNFNIQNYASGGWETAITGIGNGAVELRYDNSKKFETNSTGCLIGDDTKLQFGDSSDLQIWHDANGGDYSYIFNSGAALLKIGSDTNIVLGKTSNENYIIAKPDGAVELYYDNSKKFDTTSAGAKIHGKLEIEAASVSAGHFKCTQGSGTNTQGFLFEHTQGTHSYGTVLRLHIDGSGPDRPVMTYTSWNSSSGDKDWMTGPANGDDDFRINSAAGGTAGGWGNTRLRIEHGGTFHGSGSNDISDQRLKENITTITDASAKIKNLRGVSYNWQSRTKLDSNTKYGFIAQEMDSVVPDLVCKTNGLYWFNKAGELVEETVESRAENPDGSSWDIHMSGVIPVLVESLKEALAKIETLETKVATLEGG